MSRVPDPGRYLVLLTSAGRTVQRGWWNSEETARRKFTRWVGEYSTLLEVRITLTDEETGEQLAVWPDDRPGAVSGES